MKGVPAKIRLENIWLRGRSANNTVRNEVTELSINSHPGETDRQCLESLTMPRKEDACLLSDGNGQEEISEPLVRKKNLLVLASASHLRAVLSFRSNSQSNEWTIGAWSKLLCVLGYDFFFCRTGTFCDEATSFACSFCLLA